MAYSARVMAWCGAMDGVDAAHRVVVQRSHLDDGAGFVVERCALRDSRNRQHVGVRGLVPPLLDGAPDTATRGERVAIRSPAVHDRTHGVGGRPLGSRKHTVLSRCSNVFFCSRGILRLVPAEKPAWRSARTIRENRWPRLNHRSLRPTSGANRSPIGWPLSPSCARRAHSCRCRSRTRCRVSPNASIASSATRRWSRSAAGRSSSAPGRARFRSRTCRPRRWSSSDRSSTWTIPGMPAARHRRPLVHAAAAARRARSVETICTEVIDGMCERARSTSSRRCRSRSRCW